MPEAAPFLLVKALADAIAAVTGLARPASPNATTRCALWAHDAVEAFATEDYAVLRCYGAPTLVWSRPAEAAVQAFVVGLDHARSFALAEKITAALQAPTADDPDGLPEPRRGWAIGPDVIGEPGRFIVQVIEIRPPIHVGRDDRGRVETSVNFGVRYVPLPVAEV